MEIVASHSGNTWRAVYTVRFHDAVYVLIPNLQKSCPKVIQSTI
jgi:phage-related protein